MDKVVEHLEYWYKEKGYNCAETVLLAANEAWNLELPEDAVKLMGGFGGGMASGAVCGAISGGSVSAMNAMIEDMPQQ